MKGNDSTTTQNCWLGNPMYAEGEPWYIMHMFDEVTQDGRSGNIVLAALSSVSGQSMERLKVPTLSPSCSSSHCFSSVCR